MPGTLIKADIIAAIQTENGYTLKKSTNIVETLLEIIIRTLESGEDLMVSGFGKFRVLDKKERKGRNPAKNEVMVLPARRVVTFRCSGNLSDKINRG